MCSWLIIVDMKNKSKRVMNRALKIAFLISSRYEYLNEVNWNVNRCICGIFSHSWAVLSVFVHTKLLLAGGRKEKKGLVQFFAFKKNWLELEIMLLPLRKENFQVLSCLCGTLLSGWWENTWLVCKLLVLNSSVWDSQVLFYFLFVFFFFLQRGFITLWILGNCEL